MSDILFVDDAFKKGLPVNFVINGYQALVGLTNNAGTIKYFKDEQDAFIWCEVQQKILAGHIKGDLKVFVKPMKLHKCNTSYCNDLIPTDELYCEKCEEQHTDYEQDRKEEFRREQQDRAEERDKVKGENEDE